MKLYVNGCSFSHGHRDFVIKNGKSDISPDWVWPMLLKNNFEEVVSEAYRGSSNHRIIRRSMEYLNKINDPENWTIILQFANIERQEYYDKDLKSWIGLLVDEPIFDDKAPKNLDKSFMNKRATYKEFKNYCAIVNNNDNLILDLIIQLLAFQSFCKIKGFKNIFYTGQSSSTMLSYYFKNKELIQNFNEIQSLANIIDQSNFLMPISHIAKGHEESAEDGHPNEAGHKLFARYIIDEIKNYE
jgi:hypothetical protein|tara:strand:+ start:416 stop:1144 length:729 start_codon:yes stop_codon:yes gene_type:complete